MEKRHPRSVVAKRYAVREINMIVRGLVVTQAPHVCMMNLMFAGSEELWGAG